MNTHQKLVSAYRSLTTNLPYLFTYKNEKNIKVHNAINAIDGGVFSPMKKLLKIHKSKNIFIFDLEGRGIKPKLD